MLIAVECGARWSVYSRDMERGRTFNTQRPTSNGEDMAAFGGDAVYYWTRSIFSARHQGRNPLCNPDISSDCNKQTRSLCRSETWFSDSFVRANIRARHRED